MSMLESEIPDDTALEEFYERIGNPPENSLPGSPPRPEDLIEPVLDDPLEIAKRYYHEDNRPVLYDPERLRE